MADEAQRQLAAFELERGAELVRLAAHASLPPVLSAEVIHLLRINYFLDPPHVLPYQAEASLLLSSLCSEIDDCLYVMRPEVRDVLLKRLVADYSPARVREVARLMWEYGQRGAPWDQRPGLVEIQQLSALNFIDPPRALDWLTRARSGEGAVPVSEERWFVALEGELNARTATLQQAEGQWSQEASNLPALVDLKDVLVELLPEVRDVARLAEELDLLKPVHPQGISSERAWQALLERAWNASKMTELLALVTNELPTNPTWLHALREYWTRLSPALLVENGHFEAPPPEWKLLENHRGVIERALAAMVLVFVEGKDAEAEFVGLGFRIGERTIVFQHTNFQGGPSLLDSFIARAAGTRLFLELALDHSSFPERGLPRSNGANRWYPEVSGIHHEKQYPLMIVAVSGPPAFGMTALKVAQLEPGALTGRKVCVFGYPVKNSRTLPNVFDSIVGETQGGLRVQPGQTLELRGSSRLVQHEIGTVLVHNCFTSTGNGGAPLIDLLTGDVLGIHLGSATAPGPRGLTEGEVVSFIPPHPLLEAAIQALAAQESGSEPRFINRHEELAAFSAMLRNARRSSLLVTGPARVGKTAFMHRCQKLAREAGTHCIFIGLESLSKPTALVGKILGNLVEYKRTDAEPEVVGMYAQLADALKTVMSKAESDVVVFLDDVDLAAPPMMATVWNLVSLFKRSPGDRKLMFVLGSRSAEIPKLSLPKVHVLTLQPLSRKDIEAWLGASLGVADRHFVNQLIDATGGYPEDIARVLEELHRHPDLMFTNLKFKRMSLDLPDLSLAELHAPEEPLTYFDNPAESHGPFVVTRGTHQLSLPEVALLGHFPVTNALFDEFIKAGGYNAPEFWPQGRRGMRMRMLTRDGKTLGPSSWPSATTYATGPRHPVTGICYDEARAFVTWLRRSVQAPDGGRWSLPSEDVWEFAARGVSGRVYPWGDEYLSNRCNCAEAGFNGPTPVATFGEGVSLSGCHDMAGNVWEFVVPSQASEGCVLRGGSFENRPEEVKSSLRLFGVPRDHRPNDFGLRCAVAFPEKREPAELE